MVSFRNAVLLSVLATSALAAPSTNIAGAAYFMTNDPLGNYIVANHIAKDGSLTFAGTTYAGGQGVHGLSSDIVPDGLFGQGSMEVFNNHLFVVSPASDLIAMFAIDKTDPAKLTMVGDVQNTGYEFPTSIAINEANGHVCVLNGGRLNGVQCFTSDAQKGLKKIPGSTRPIGLFNQTTPGTGDPGSSSSLIFSADGSKLHVAVKGVFGPEFTDIGTPGYVATWSINHDGSLSETHNKAFVPKGGLAPFALTTVRGSDGAIVLADAFLGVDIMDFNHGTKPTKGSAIPVTGQKMSCWIAYSKMTDRYYLSDFEGSQQIEIKVDPKTLTATDFKLFPFQADSIPTDIAIGTVNGQDFLYNLAPNSQQINVLKLTPENKGKSFYIQHMDIGTAMTRAKVTYNKVNLQGMAVWTK